MARCFAGTYLRRGGLFAPGDKMITNQGFSIDAIDGGVAFILRNRGQNISFIWHPEYARMLGKLLLEYSDKAQSASV